MANALAAWAAQPLRSVQDFQDADAERESRGVRNALLQMQVQQARQGMADQQAIRNALVQHGPTEQGANALMQLGAFEQAQQIQQQLAARQKAEAAARQEATKQQALRSLMPVQGIDANRVSGVAGPRPEALGVVGQRRPFDPAMLIASGVPAAEVEKMSGIFAPKLANATPGSVVYDPATGQQRFSVPVAPRQQALPQIAQLQEYEAGLPAGDPRRQQVRAVMDNLTRPPARADNSTKAPAGYRYTPAGDLEPIPGGPADAKRVAADAATAKSADGAIVSLDALASAANEVMLHPGLNGITGLRGMIPNIPGTDAANAEALLTTLKSKTAFSVLQAMRDASKTGGALGAVSDKEMKLLESNLGALEKAQSVEQFKAELGKIVKFAEGAKDRIRSASGQVQGAAPQGAGGLSKAEAEELQKLRQRFGRGAN